MLSKEECERTQRYHFDLDRMRYLVWRGLLRTILARYLRTQPSAIAFSYGPHGKPFLAHESADDSLYFNVSHCENLALFAFTLNNSAIGVDIERVRSMPDLLEISTRFFSARESGELTTLRSDRRQEGFFNCWTRKEAFIKAIGDGLSHPLDSFDVSLAPDTPAQVFSIQRSPAEASKWILQALTPAADYIAALAVRADKLRLCCWQAPSLTSSGYPGAST
jgi:4'-phosphopantetheinyl transferase